MCGITGIMTASGAPPDRTAILSMQQSLIHRGPDGEGLHFADSVGMAQRRLAIIDLETGDQPFRLDDGVTLIANAEIYNYVELRREFANVSFTSKSDCEVALHLYSRDGDGFANRLRGMYAIAIHDPGERRLLLARDPFGIKQIYYTEGSFGFAFASEPQALIASGIVAADVRSEAAMELLQLQFTTGRETIFPGIYRVLPGETLIVESGRIARRLRRAALPEGPPEEVDEATALARLETALLDSVEIHQRSDVPYGMFLSGGIDSSAVIALMAKLNDRPVRAFTVGFSDTDAVDERDHARAVAAAVGAEHVEIDFTEQDFWKTLPQIARIMDDPVADYAELPTYKLASVASRDLKVILCGEGGDELFGGYGRYRSMMRPWWRYKRAMRSRGALEGLGVSRIETRDWRKGVAASESVADVMGRTPLQVAQATDCADWLAHDLLIKLDRCLMAHGVEGRTPMLDSAVAEAVFRLPDRLKVRGRVGKWILRKWLDGVLPDAKPFSPKRGFTVPVGEWLIRKGATLGPLVARQAGVADLCRPEAVEKIFVSNRRRAGFAAWVLLFYALWHRYHVEGVREDGDIFDLLGTN
ncbi:MAG: asparagine synthase (glutamine-hydrolyzing) [Proteobacteria bacterium]|nr:asparagine synthase (glutamine-hydrolyzing) [Pseudomonadota bacterium]